MTTARHVIIEGFDASGKDTLIASLKDFKLRGKDEPHFVLRERASTSLGGPIANLSEWVDDDLETMSRREPSIYNRHPIISELIYGPLIRGHLVGRFTSTPWVRLAREVVAAHCLVVFCHPPFRVITENLERQGEAAHMPGVVKRAHKLYREYSRTIVGWRGTSITYDYTKGQQRELEAFIRNHITGGNA